MHMNNILHFLLALLAPGSAGIMMSPIWRDRGKWFIPTVVVTTVVVAGAALSPVILNPGGGGGETPPSGGITQANIWVDTNGGSCVDNSSLVSYSDAVACSSLATAYANAEAGDTIGVKGGNYSGDWVLAYRSDLKNASPRCDPYGKWGTVSQANCVRISNFAGDSITLTGNLEFHGSQIWFNGVTSSTDMANWRTRTFSFNVNGYTSLEGDSGTQWPNDNTLEGINTGNFGTYSADRSTVYDVDVGPRLLDVPCQYPENRINQNGASGHNPVNVWWERVAIHDQNRTQAAANQDCHYGGLQIWGVTNVTLNRVVMESNVVYQIDISGGGTNGATISNSSFSCPAENSWVGDVCDGQRAIQFQGGDAWDKSGVVLTGNVSANGANGLYGCDNQSSCNPTVSNNTDLAESVDAPPVPSASITANLWMAASASNNCTGGRSSTPIDYTTAASQNKVCSTWQNAYNIAANGDTVAVKNGTFSPSGLGGADRYIDSATVHSTPVTFVCGDSGSTDSVEENTRGFYIRKANGIIINGRCFRFKSVNIGEGGDTGVQAQNITLDNVRMETFNISGAPNVTIKNSNIGPSVACYAVGDTGRPASQRCQSGQPWPESWYYSTGNAAADTANGQPQMRYNRDTSPTGFVFSGNYVHDFQSRDTDGSGGDLHGGCFQSQVGGTLNWTISNNAFERCTSQGLLFDSNGPTYSNLTIENNFFGYAVEDWSTGGCCTEASSSARDLKFKTTDAGQTMSNVLIRYNSFTHGMDLTSSTATSYSNVRIIGNILGKDTPCRTGSGVIYNRNVYAGFSCGDVSARTNQTYNSSAPYATYSEGSLQTQAWTPVAGPILGAGPFNFENWITETTSDYALTTDYYGNTRTSGSRDAGAVER